MSKFLSDSTNVAGIILHENKIKKENGKKGYFYSVPPYF